MSWSVEEYAEDSLKDYLERHITAGTMNVYAAWDNDEIKYPCVVVHAGESRNVGATEFNGVREIDVQIAVMVDATDSTSPSKTARERNRDFRDEVIEALAQTALHDDLNALNPKGVVFSRAMLGNTSRSVAADRRLLVSELTVECICAPKVVI